MRTLVVIAMLFVFSPWIRSWVASEELTTETWPNGLDRVLQAFRLDASGQRVAQGRYAAWYQSGAPLVEGRYVHGHREGLWRWWYEDGRKLGECDYEKGVGIYRGWHPNGGIYLRGRYEDDQRVGVWIEFYPSGRKRLQGSYKDGRQEGIWTAWTDSDPQQAAQSEWHDGERVR
jgi:antitoxin component YwqK of YwqJK toxin-antitoxin module